jgi:hypothetical protein
VRVTERSELMGFLHVEEHVRAFHRKRTSSETYVACRHLPTAAATDYCINDRGSGPLLLITVELDPSSANCTV